ncbi:hypothetical protein ADIWIN_0149 [Winogradskyella psychrotolerans RS-3]|uniref:LTD domain-containing protein n=1 Tax=Winogradskyella psychrotolerans RS-3 TaxID=641526 RepID=S7VWY1_9FLAO|nr:lamin tail domain-containing protein [Winogradskyella psychrotolerans]EPR74785.1 hypothetical protein ADIWIN_0149 [Winogradskyella psychrotolerans RS-3]
MKNLYPFLIALCLSCIGFAQTSADGWINEIHYDNTSTDAGEGIEIVIADAATYPLENWTVVLYNGNNGETYGTVTYDAASTTSIDSGFTIAWQAKSGIQNDTEGMALVYNGTTLVQFLSYEGSFTATNGIALGQTSTDIGVSETGSTPIGESLQLSGTGTMYSDFTWHTPATATTGTLNTGQSLVPPCYPTTQASAYNTTSIGTTSATLNWTVGNGDNVLVLVKKETAVDTDPSNGVDYIENTVFGTGNVIGTGNYVVQSGPATSSTTSSVSITGLEEATTYHVAVYEYNATNFCYNLNEITGSFTTDCTTPTDVSAFNAIGNDATIDLNWTNTACFDELLIIAKEGSAVTFTPTGDGTTYSANPIFGAGAAIGTDEYAVYKGTGTSETITGLTNSTAYHFKVFARKGLSWSTGIIGNATPDLLASSNSIMITEIMINPASVGDTNGEYFEVYNTTDSPIDLIGWVILDTHTDSHTIATSVVVPAYGFAVLGRNSDTLANGGVTIDYQYDNISISNFADEIILTNASGTGIDSVAYGGAAWPDPMTSGPAMIFIGSDIEDNNDGSLWAFSTVAEGIAVDFGSPGINGTDQIVSYLVFKDGAWNTTPSTDTDTRIGLIKPNESTTFTTDVDLDDLYIEEGASLTVNSGTTLSLNTLTLESSSQLYSSLILDGTLTGSVIYKRHINTFNTTTGSVTGQNDLISAPVTNASQTFGVFRGTNANIPSGTIGGGATMYLFGPFDNDSASNPYTLYSAADDATALTAGIGYRTASTDTSTFTFVGDVETGTVAVGIDIGSAYNWNLIGNPYPSYINAGDFLTENASFLDENAVGIYGYDGSALDNWTIINFNNANTSENITPGQGFLVAAEGSATLNFTPEMRRASGGDDFILGRTLDTNAFLSLNLENATSNYHTDFYFNSNSTRALDPGYDAAIFNGNSPAFYIYSHLVENNQGKAMAIQSLGDSDLSDVTIPLGVHANEGEAITFSINASTLPSTVEVYLEDTVANTFTLLNSSEYIITPTTSLNGIGRFYLRVTESALSINDTTLDALSIYTQSDEKTIVIAGSLVASTTANVYDMQGRLVASELIMTTTMQHRIDTSNFSAGIYVVQLQNTTGNRTQKVIIR